MFPEPLSRGKTAYTAGVGLVMLFWLLPLLAVMLTAMRSAEELMAGNYWGAIARLSLAENVAAVFSQTHMLRFFLNSLIITAPSVLGVLALLTLAGIVLSRHRFPGAHLIFSLFVAGNFLPAQILMIPLRDLMVALGLYDHFAALILFHIAFQTSFAMLFMRNFIAALPDELFQAARAEGATPAQTLRFVVLPLMRPALAASAILTFTFVWNDYFWAVVLTQSDAVKPVTAGLATLFVAIPPVVMFFTMERHFIAGLTMGAVKG